jgi:hypothetical protein
MFVTIKKEVSLEILFNLLTSAFEGGSNYWIERAEKTKRPKPEDIYTEDNGLSPNVYLQNIPLSKGGEVTVFDCEAEDEQGNQASYKLNLATLKKGIQVMAEKYPKHFADAMDLENGCGDADTGDCFLQCCCFGEVIYG